MSDMKARLRLSGFLMLIFCLGTQMHAQQRDTNSIASLEAKAESGDASAQFSLGNKYLGGITVQQNTTEALEWYRKAAEQGDVPAQVALGVIYSSGQGGAPVDYVESFKWLQKAAMQGNVTAQFLVGQGYEYGLGVSQDYVKAVKWLTKAAEQNEADAQSDLGLCYAKGLGVPQDYTEAVKWLRKAADQGDALAQYNVGFCYATGQGLAQDYDEAIKWFRKAADHGNPDAEGWLGLCYARGQGVAQDYTEAAKWFQKSADQGVPLAQCQLGVCYSIGRGVPQDYSEAVKWYQKAADQGFAAAQSLLGSMYAYGDEVLQDYSKAVDWDRKAAVQGDANAQYNLGVNYAQGHGVPQDFVQAYEWVNLAAAQGQTNAIMFRGILINSMTPEQIAEGQRLSAAFVPQLQSPTSSSNPGTPVVADFPVATGTGFFITEDGYLISNYHVVKDATKVRLLTSQGTVDAQIVQVDAADDLALLKTAGDFTALPIVSSRTATLGGTVATVGFPDPGLQGFYPKLAKGEIAALAGAADDPRYFQISVPVQPGNSGGALVDEHGNVVGIVSAKLDAATALEASGALPENVNYAIKSSFLLSFLESVPAVDAELKVPNVADEKFEDVVKSTQNAAVLVLVY